MSRSLQLVALLLLPLHSLAAQQPRGCADAARHNFDFWIGDWTVSDSVGTTVYGTNLITSEEGGCLIHEHWVGSKGGSGQSLNFYDLDLKKWVQVWVGSGGENLRLEGALENGKMVFTGTSTGSNGGKVEHRAIWSKEPDGRVRQYWKQTSDGGKTWQFVIDGWYKLKPKAG